MLTLFTAPKPFKNHIALIQRNALRSWTRLHPGVEIILFGRDEGVAETAVSLGLVHEPEVETSEYGTPLVSSLFARASARARHPLLAYVNADILLLPDLAATVERVAKRFPRFLLAGRRWNLEVREEIEFSEGWNDRLAARATAEGTLFGESGIDYFIFPRGALGTLPPFAVGRPAWDNWTIYQARERRVPVVDATACVTAIHQNHDYSHVPQGTGRLWEGPEMTANWAVAGGFERLFTLRDATHLATKRGIVPASTWAHLSRRPRAWLLLHPRLHACLRWMSELASRLRHRLLAGNKGKE